MGVSSRMASSTLSSEDPLGASANADLDAQLQAPPEKKPKVTPDSPTSQHPQPEVELEEVDQDEFAFLDTITHLATLQSELDGVKEQLALAKNNGHYVPLRLFRSRGQNVVNVTDISQGLWCELQVEYRHLHPTLKRTAEWTKLAERGSPVQLKTAGMKQGTAIHLKKELEVHEKVEVKIQTREDNQAVQLIDTYTQLSCIKSAVGEARGLEREIAVFGDPFGLGVLIRGIIDQLQYSPDSRELTLLDYKTRQSNSLPGEAQKKGNALQLMLYKYLLDQLTCGATPMDLLSQHAKLNLDTVLSTGPVEYIKQHGLWGLLTSSNHKQNEASPKESAITFGMVVECVSKLIAGLDFPLVGTLLVQYEYQGTGEVIGVETVEYDEDWMKSQLENCLGFWTGKRQAKGVDIEDCWKCNFCQFRDVCVWRMRKQLECSPAAKILPESTSQYT